MASSSFNCIVYDRLVDWTVGGKQESTCKEAERERVYEWGGVSYLLQKDPEQGSIKLSLSLPSPQMNSSNACAWGGAYKGE
jgi:hypothetical protein